MSPRLLIVALTTCALCLGAASPLTARDTTDPFWNYRSDAERGELPFDDSVITPWVESGGEPPSLPPDDALTQLDLEELQAGMTAYTHQPSISVDASDRVPRYWLIIKGDGGGYNATYEGLRCNTREYKIYAYGHPERSEPVRLVKAPKWRSLDADLAGYRREVARTYFCGGVRPRTMREIDAALRGNLRGAYPYTEYTE